MSFFNSNNIGDKVIADILLNKLSSQYSVVPCSIEGSFEIRNRYIGEKLNLFQRALIKASKYFKFRYLTSQYKKFLKQYKKELKGCSRVFLGGGNLLMDYSDKTKSYQKVLDYISIAADNNVDCFALSVGIGPFYSTEQARQAVAALNQCKKITFRDEGSLRLFLENGGIAEKASICYDPAFLFAGLKRIATDNVNLREKIAINIIYPSWEGEQRAVAALNGYVKLIKEILQRSPSESIELFCTEANDYHALEYVADKVGESKVSVQSVENIDDLIALYQNTKTVIGARMHSLIIAYSCHIPMLGLSWAAKVNEFFNIIERPDYCFSLDELEDSISDICNKLGSTMPEWNYDEIISKADMLLQENLIRINQL